MFKAIPNSMRRLIITSLKFICVLRNINITSILSLMLDTCRTAGQSQVPLLNFWLVVNMLYQCNIEMILHVGGIYLYQLLNDHTLIDSMIFNLKKIPYLCQHYGINTYINHGMTNTKNLDNWITMTGTSKCHDFNAISLRLHANKCPVLIMWGKYTFQHF